MRQKLVSQLLWNRSNLLNMETSQSQPAGTASCDHTASGVSSADSVKSSSVEQTAATPPGAHPTTGTSPAVSETKSAVDTPPADPPVTGTGPAATATPPGDPPATGTSPAASETQSAVDTPPVDPPVAGTGPAAPGTKSSIVSVVNFVASNLSFPEFLTNREVVSRRHSISILDRPPPVSSNAAEIVLTPRPDIAKTKLLGNELKDGLSDFGSCISGSSSVDDSDSSDTKESSDGRSFGCQSINEKKRIKKLKRKNKLTPGKDQFLKKPNTLQSPQ